MWDGNAVSKHIWQWEKQDGREDAEEEAQDAENIQESEQLHEKSGKSIFYCKYISLNVCIYPVVESGDGDDMKEEDTKHAMDVKDALESEQ